MKNMKNRIFFSTRDFIGPYKVINLSCIKHFQKIKKKKIEYKKFKKSFFSFGGLTYLFINLVSFVFIHKNIASDKRGILF